MLHIDITKRLDRFSLEIVLDIDVPGITAVFGPSGAGKSTFLKIMMREQVPNSGSVIINGYHLNNLKKKEIPDDHKDCDMYGIE